MEEIRKAVRTTTDTSLDGKRVFDVLVSQKSVELEVKMGKQKFVRIPWRSVVDKDNKIQNNITKPGAAGRTNV